MKEFISYAKNEDGKIDVFCNEEKKFTVPNYKHLNKVYSLLGIKNKHA